MKKLIVLLSLAFFLLLGNDLKSANPAPSPTPTPSPSPTPLSKALQVVQKIKEINPGLKDFCADIKVNVRVQYSFIPLPFKVQGKYYYKRPDKHKLELKNAPQFLQKYPKIFGWQMPETDKNKVEVKEDELTPGKLLYHLIFTPINGRGDVIYEEMWVDKDSYVFPRQMTHYKNDGQIQVNVKYKKEKDFFLFDQMNADFTFPKISLTATAQANYENYRLNIGLSDEFFNEGDKKENEKSK